MALSVERQHHRRSEEAPPEITGLMAGRQQTSPRGFHGEVAQLVERSKPFGVDTTE